MTTTAIPHGTPPTPHNPDTYDYTTLPPRFHPHTGVTVETAIAEIRGAIEHGINHNPRSLQKRIGPSEIGNPCDHCLAAKLAGWEQTVDGTPWLPFIGTAVHAELERIITEHENNRNAPHTTGIRWLTEHRVTVGSIGGTEITGSTDLFDTAAGLVVDHKIVGTTKLRHVRAHGPNPTYRAQAHLYGRGWVNAGHTVNTVSIWFLPRNDMRGFDNGLLWQEPYNEQVAVNALQRANRIHNNLTALAAVSTETRDTWITGLPRADGCYDCPNYPDWDATIPKPGHQPVSNQLKGLIV